MAFYCICLYCHGNAKVMTGIGAVSEMGQEHLRRVKQWNEIRQRALRADHSKPGSAWALESQLGKTLNLLTNKMCVTLTCCSTKALTLMFRCNSARWLSGDRKLCIVNKSDIFCEIIGLMCILLNQRKHRWIIVWEACNQLCSANISSRVILTKWDQSFVGHWLNTTECTWIVMTH